MEFISFIGEKSIDSRYITTIINPLDAALFD